MLRGFTKVVKETKPLYDKYLKETKGMLHSDMYFPVLYAYDDSFTAYYRELEGYLVLYVEDFVFHERYCYAPLGHYYRKSFQRMMYELEELFKEQGLTLMFSDVPEWMLLNFRGLENEYIHIWYSSERSDYIYKTEDFKEKLATSASRYKCRRFIRDNHPVYEEIHAGNKLVCFNITRKYWCELHDCSYCADGCEKKALMRLLDCYEDMDINGILVYDGKGEPLAFSIVGRLKGQLLLMISKRKKMPGISEYIHTVLLSLYGDGMKTVNNGIDLGLEGQRVFKSRCSLAYRLEHNYNLRLKLRK